MKEEVWKEIETLHQEFERLNIRESVDYEKYYLYSLITHSTAIEGSTLTEAETQLLFDEGVTAGGKPLVYHLMNEDLKNAYDHARAEAKQNTRVTPIFLQELNAMVMKSTGGVHHVAAGDFDASKGEYRLCGVTARTGGRSYMNYLKVPAMMEELCRQLEMLCKEATSREAQYELSFKAHLNLVTIHPWVDGNGRTARLLMHYLQFCYHLFPTKVFFEDRGAYIGALQEAQEKGNHKPFVDFMTMQLKKSLALEIERFKAADTNAERLLF